MVVWEHKYKKLIEEFNQLESDLIPLKAHIKGISEYFESKNYPFYMDIADWFLMSSSINSVNFNRVRYDSAFTMCEPAYEYEIEKQNLHSKLMNELTKFLFVYSGFEALLNELALGSCPHNRGKINAAKFYIKDIYSTNYQSLKFYTKILSLQRKLISESTLKEHESHFSTDACTDINGVGLKVVYKLRNKLAHGDYIFPEPEDWSSDLPLEPEITQNSTRLILLSIQMIMLAIHKNDFENLFLYESEVIDSSEENEWMVNEFSFLNSFHIKSKHKNEMQLELKLD